MNHRDRRPGYLLLPLLLLMVACDIEPVGAGNWAVQTQSSTGTDSSTWTIAVSGEIIVSGGGITISDGSAVLAGSRISWSGTMANPADPAVPLNVNFNGTVDRDSMQGTLFTTLGNWSVTGTRQ